MSTNKSLEFLVIHFMRQKLEFVSNMRIVEGLERDAINCPPYNASRLPPHGSKILGESGVMPWIYMTRFRNPHCTPIACKSRQISASLPSF